MSEPNEMAKQVAADKQGGREQDWVMRPAVDIYEDDVSITVKADMPGVTREYLDIQIDRDTLTIEGKAEIQMPEGLEAIYADVRSTSYQRSFTLSHELDGEKADASLTDGVLTLNIPKRKQYQPRKIEISVS
jgi:HSP20 family protein